MSLAIVRRSMLLPLPLPLLMLLMLLMLAIAAQAQTPPGKPPADGPPQGERPGPHRGPPIAELRRLLDLDAAQAKAVEDILRSHRERMDALQARSREDRERIGRETDARLRGVLAPAQFAEFERWKANRPPPGRGPRDGRRPPPPEGAPRPDREG